MCFSYMKYFLNLITKRFIFFIQSCLIIPHLKHGVNYLDFTNPQKYGIILT